MPPKKTMTSTVDSLGTNSDPRVLLNVALEAGIPIILWGSPGTAKTDIIKLVVS